MQTQISTPPRHRWLIALPLLAVMVMVPLADGLRRIGHRAQTASLVSVTDADVRMFGDQVLSVQKGSVVVRDGEHSVLVQGSALVASKTSATIRVLSYDLQGWNGGYFVTVNGDRATVAALNTAVVVTQGDQHMVIAPFSQWTSDGPLGSLSSSVSAFLTSRAFQSLPDAFIAESLADVRRLTDAQVLNVEAAADAPISLGALQFSAAEDRADSAKRMAQLQQLFIALQSGGSDALEALSDASVPTLLSSSEGQQTLPTLLSAACNTGKCAQLLPYFTVTPDRYLLALFHPMLRDSAWVLPAPTLSADDAFLRLFTFPRADGLSDAYSTVAFRQWQFALQEFLHTRKDSDTIVAQLIPMLSQQVDRFRVLQYPERAERYTTVMKKVAEQYGIPTQTSSVTAVSIAEPVETAPTVEHGSSAFSDSSESSASSVDSEALVAHAQTILEKAGFMMLSTTSIRPVGAQLEIQHIALGTAHGDVSMHFLFDPQTRAVTQIAENGSISPFPMSLEQFVEWGKGE